MLNILFSTMMEFLCTYIHLQYIGISESNQCKGGNSFITPVNSDLNCCVVLSPVRIRVSNWSLVSLWSVFPVNSFYSMRKLFKLHAWCDDIEVHYICGKYFPWTGRDQYTESVSYWYWFFCWLETSMEGYG